MTGNLFDREASNAARDDALERVEEHASPAWKQLAYEAGKWVARMRVDFTADDIVARMLDVNDELAIAVHEPRAMGAVMQKLKADGVIVPTDRFRNSERKSTHSSPRRIWKAAPSL